MSVAKPKKLPALPMFCGEAVLKVVEEMRALRGNSLQFRDHIGAVIEVRVVSLNGKPVMSRAEMAVAKKLRARGEL